MKVAIYCRVSTDEQTTENQKIPLIQYCERMDWEYEVFEEKVSTRKTRPVQWELYNKLLRKEYDGLVIYKFDRWARSLKELVEHIENLVERGVRIYSYTENVDLASSMGRAMFHIISAFAQLERDIIRERTIAGLNRARARGKKLGRPHKGKNYARPSRAQVSEQMAKGLTVREIAKELGTSRYWAHQVMKEVKENGKKD